MTSIEQKIESVLNRRAPHRTVMNRDFSLTERDCLTSTEPIVRYIRLAMLEVDDEYTQRIKAAGENIKAFLGKHLSGVSFHYQGSILTNTHIRGNSDIDLLVLCEKFFSYAGDDIRRVLFSSYSPDFNDEKVARLQKVLSLPPYEGNVFVDLRNLRKESEMWLTQHYAKCDISQAKAIKVTEQHLHINVDVVIASLYDNVELIINEQKIEYRGVRVFNNSSTTSLGKIDYPFQQASLLNERSAQTHGRLKRMIRLLKTLKAEAQENIGFSSFDIYSLCYALPTTLYCNADYLQLVPILTNFFANILIDSQKREKLRSVDGREKIFTDASKIREAEKLFCELLDLNTLIQER